MKNDKKLLTNVKSNVTVYLTINIKKLLNIVLSLARIRKYTAKNKKMIYNGRKMKWKS